MLIEKIFIHNFTQIIIFFHWFAKQCVSYIIYDVRQSTKNFAAAPVCLDVHLWCGVTSHASGCVCSRAANSVSRTAKTHTDNVVITDVDAYDDTRKTCQTLERNPCGPNNRNHTVHCVCLRSLLLCGHTALLVDVSHVLSVNSTPPSRGVGDRSENGMLHFATLRARSQLWITPTVIVQCKLNKHLRQFCLSFSRTRWATPFRPLPWPVRVSDTNSLALAGSRNASSGVVNWPHVEALNRHISETYTNACELFVGSQNLNTSSSQF